MTAAPVPAIGSGARSAAAWPITVLAFSAIASTALLAAECVAFRVDLSHVMPVAVECGSFAAGAVVLHRVGLGRAGNVCACIALIVYGRFLHPAIEHLGLRFGRPMIDRGLAHADAMLGFDWTAYHDWFHAHRLAGQVTTWAYLSFDLQLLLIACALAAAGDTRRMIRMLAAMALTLLITDLVFIAWPADNAGVFYGASDPIGVGLSRQFMAALRSRSAIFDVLDNPTGLVSFPSYHTAGALIIVWTLRRRWYFAPALALEAALLLATPVWGAHFLVDLFGGAVVAAVSVGVVEAGTIFR